MTARLAVLLLGAAAAACGAPAAKAPQPARVDLPHAFAAAFRTDATGDPGDAVRAYLTLVDAAAGADADPWQVPALEAALDALATRAMPSLGDAAPDAALERRTRAPVVADLEEAEAAARGPFARGLVARTLTELAQRAGDAARAAASRADTGCAQEAVVIGPTTWTPVTGVEQDDPVAPAGAPLQASYATDGAFGTPAPAVVVRGRGCAVALSAESSRPGVRDVVVDLEVDRSQTLGLALRAHGAAVLRAAGAVVLRRPFELGDGEAVRFARVQVTPGTLRVVARVGTAKEDDSVEIDAWGEDGRPLAASAPAVGSVGTARVLGVSPAGAGDCHGAEEALLSAAADLAGGDAREAERELWPVATRAGAPPELGLVYGRAVETAPDLSQATRAERARSAYEHVLESWPSSWEAVIAHAVLAGVRRGREEAGVETLRDLDTLRAKMGPSKPAALDAFDAMVSGRERLFDRAAEALARARGPLAGTAILEDAARAASPSSGRDLAARECDPARATARDGLACFDALRAAGEGAEAAAELSRVRGVLGAPQRWLPVELRQAMAYGDDSSAGRVFGEMLPAERTLAALSIVDGASAEPDARASLLRAASVARDAPAAIAPLLRALGDDPARAFDGTAERLAAQDRASPILPGAPTAVLAHDERYDLSPSGLLHWVLFDVRRVSGTTDVEENAQAAPPEITGRSATRSLRRRILKRDGRILEPDRTPGAAQAHADLSQLEEGDVVEAVYEGWALPDDAGDVGIDTPDLLPERVAVHDATIELRVPRALRSALWSHPLLGKPGDRVDGDARVLTWHVTDAPVRRAEDGVPKMDRSASVSFSTARWSDVARALRETVAALDEHDPEIAAWARDAAGLGPKDAPTRATVEAIVTAAGRALREAEPGTLSDYDAGVVPVQQQTARTFLTSHEGSRSWLVLRSLRELGVPCDLRVAEDDPFSADPSFPPHYGRFAHPLLVAHVGGKDVWIDADVEGPPLPAGRISPELRGRFALATDGTIAPVPDVDGADERDEVDVRLALDEHGNARGTFAVVLRGRDAQELAEELVRIVGAERQRALRDVVLSWLPWANVDEVQLSSSEGSWQVSMRAQVTVSGYAQREGARTWLLPGLDALHWSRPHARVSSLAAAFATRAGRANALAVSTAVQYHVHRRIELPKGAAVARMPGPLDVKGKLVDASREITVAGGGRGRAIEDEFALRVSTGTIAPADYDRYVRVVHAADDGFLASTRVSAP